MLNINISVFVKAHGTSFFPHGNNQLLSVFHIKATKKRGLTSFSSKLSPLTSHKSDNYFSSVATFF